MIKLKFLIFLILAFSSVVQAASKVDYKRAYTLDLKKERPNFLHLQQYHRSIVLFYAQSEASAHKKNKSLYTFLKLIEDAYASSANCFLAGHKLTKSGNDKCYATAEMGCDHNGFTGVAFGVRCNTSLFGPGQDGKGICVPSRMMNRDAMKPADACAQSNMSLTTPEIVKGLIEDEQKMAAFEQTAADVESFCQESPAEAACVDQRARVAKIREDIEKARENFEKLTQGQSIDATKAVGILDRCEQDYRNEAEDNLFGSFFMSTRKIGSTLVATSCSANQQMQSVTSSELNTLSESFDDVYKHTSLTSILGDGTKIGAELSIKNMLMHKLNANGATEANLDSYIDQIKRDNEQLARSPYLEILAKSREDVKNAIDSGAIVQDDPQVQADKLNTLMDAINSQCKEITDHARSFRYGRSVSDEAKARQNAYIQQQQIAYNQKMDAFFNENKKLSKYMATSDFRSDFFDPSPDFAKDCKSRTTWTNSQKVPANKLSARDIRKLNREVSEDLDEDLEELMDLIPRDNKSVSRMENDLKELLKYRPYLAGQVLQNNLMYPGLQDMQAQFLCREMREIYNNDELWRGAEAAVSGAGLVMAGVLMATGVGSPLGATLAVASSATFFAAEGTLAARKYDDGLNLEDSADAQYRLGFSSTSEHTANVDAAESQQVEAMIDGGAAVLGGGIGLYADGVQATRRLSSAGTRAATSVDDVTEVATDAVQTGTELMISTPTRVVRDAPINVLPTSETVIQLGSDASTTSSRAIAVIDESSDTGRALARNTNIISTTADEVFDGTSFYADTVTPLVRRFAGTLDNIEDANVKFVTRLGDVRETLSSGRLLEDGTGVFLKEGSENFEFFRAQNLGQLTDGGLVLRFGDEIDQAKILHEAQDAAGNAYTAQKNFVFRNYEVPPMNQAINTVDDLQDSIYRFSALTDAQKAKVYQTAELKVSRGLRVSDEEIAALAFRDQIIRGGTPRAEAILDIVTRRDPSIIDDMIRGTSPQSVARREMMREAVSSGARSTQTALPGPETRAVDGALRELTPANALPPPGTRQLPAPGSTTNVPALRTASEAPQVTGDLVAASDEVIDAVDQSLDTARTVARSSDEVVEVVDEAVDTARRYDRSAGIALSAAITGREEISAAANAALSGIRSSTTTPPPVVNPAPEVPVVPPADPESTDSVEPSIKIEYDSAKAELIVTFKGPVTACYVEKRYEEEDDDGNVETKTSKISDLTSGNKKKLSRTDADYVAYIMCKTDDDFKLAKDLATSALTVVGPSEVIVHACSGDDCATDSEDRQGIPEPRYTPAPLQQITPPNTTVPNVPILNTL